MRVAEGLYYYGARYLDPKYSMWLSTDPALGEYIPGLDKDKNKNLPGMGGLFNQINANLFHAFGNNPIRYVDQDGRVPIKPTSRIGQKAHTFFEDSLTVILLGEQAAQGKDTYADRTLNKILNSLFNLVFGVDTRNKEVLQNQDPAVDEISSPSKRPDLVVRDDIKKTLTVYELKPDSCKSGYKNRKAETQIKGYIEELSKNSSGYTVQGGTDIPDGLTLPYPEAGAKATITFTADKKIPGLYYYSIDDGN